MSPKEILAKGLGIKLDGPRGRGKDEVTRGESIESTDTYVEDEPTVGE